jgi:peptide/nickel transport system ATP-binding protein
MSAEGTPPNEAVLAITGVAIAYGRHGNLHRAVDGVTFSLAAGETVALVGESGSGKTSIANAVLGLLPPTGHVVDGSISVLGRDIVGSNERALRRIRGRVIGLVPQDPMVSLNPTIRIGQQIGETVRLRGDVPKRSIPAEVFEFLERAGLDDPRLRARQYPHELSGGMRQRVLIANALAGNPKILVADEPTSALDVTVQRKMLDHLEHLVTEAGISLLLITHDLAVASDRADRVVVMNRGAVVEEGASQHVLAHPHDPYTQRLIAAAPGFSARDVEAAPRGSSSSTDPETVPGGDEPPILRLTDIVKEFHLPAGRGEPSRFRALDGVSLEVHQGETLALVGESGSGKTTAMRIAMRLETPTSGQVTFDGSDITSKRWRQVRRLRQQFQLVHQDPFSSLDPRFSVQQSIVEPLVSFGIGTAESRRARAVELLDQVALPQSYLHRRPSELSGGQRQRVAIARSLALKPKLVLLDEPVSALDVSVQAQILSLLAELQRELSLSYFFITHDLAVVAQIAHHVAVMSRGKIVESGTTHAIFNDPQTDYTRQLIDAIPGRRWEVRKLATTT